MAQYTIKIRIQKLLGGFTKGVTDVIKCKDGRCRFQRLKRYRTVCKYKRKIKNK